MDSVTEGKPVTTYNDRDSFRIYYQYRAMAMLVLKKRCETKHSACLSTATRRKLFFGYYEHYHKKHVSLGRHFSCFLARRLIRICSELQLYYTILLKKLGSPFQKSSAREGNRLQMPTMLRTVRNNANIVLGTDRIGVF